jgi:peptidoglycan biosynthesis protein MviN/MurJ (putative lipid II flippase)
MYNVGQIFGASFLCRSMEFTVLVYGTIIGAALHLLVQFPMLIKFGFRWTPALDIRHTGLDRSAETDGSALVDDGWAFS